MTNRKLKHFEPIYYINLERSPERKAYMEEQFAQWGVENYTRIEALDGLRSGLRSYLDGDYPRNVLMKEMACTISHLKAIHHWLMTSKTSYAIICEDDLDMSTVEVWPFTWKELMDHLPYDWDVVQLVITNPDNFTMNIHARFEKDYGTVCYVITRHYAEKLMKLHVHGDRYKLDYTVRPRAVSDELIYNAGKTYSIPVFLYNVDFGSSIHSWHNGKHQLCREAYHKWWFDPDVKHTADPFFRL
ncbi:MAG: glycosyltransferase family 25 protein [Parachlamydiales bacterium]|jgi:GR25 family glycosyltransferase involved in LPS biosynthesis